MRDWIMKYSEAKDVLERQEAAKAVLAKYKELAAVHETHGFKSRREFIKALQEIEQGERGKGRGRGLTPDTIDQIQKLKSEGKSNAEISRTVGVSPLTVGKYVKGQAGKGSAKPKAAKPRAAAKPKTTRKPRAKKK